MISQELQERCKRKFNGTNRYIFLASDEREEALHKALPRFFQAQDNIYIGPNNNVWEKAVLPRDNLYGKQIVEAIVDSTISEEVFYNLILPACETRCIRMEFFE